MNETKVVSKKIEPPDYFQFRKLTKGDFALHVRRRIEIAEDIKNLEREKKELDESIMIDLIAAKAPDKIIFDDRTIRRAKGTHSTINGKLLLSKGVKPSVLEACTLVTSFEYLDFRVRKEEEKEEE